VVLTGFVLLAAGPAYAAGKVAPNPRTFTVSEGGLQNVVFTLDAPIIAMSPNPTVVLTFTIDDPTRLSLSPTTLVWQTTEWTQPRTLQVSALLDGIHDLSNSVTVHVTTASASAYYDNYTTSFTATITDIDPPPTTTTVATTSTTTTPAVTTTTVAPTTTVVPRPTVSPTTAAVAPTPPSTGVSPALADTGTDDTIPLSVGLLSVLAGALFLAVFRSRRPDRFGRGSP
jgi:hypothetical protein